MPHRIPSWPAVEAGTPAPWTSEGGGWPGVNAKQCLTAKQRFAVAPTTQRAANRSAATWIAATARPGYTGRPRINANGSDDDPYSRGAVVVCAGRGAGRGGRRRARRHRAGAQGLPVGRYV